MSRGPGRRQRAILAALDKGRPAALTHPDDTPAEQVATRRAAYTLEAQGQIELISVKVRGVRRLLAYRPEDVPEAQRERLAAMKAEKITGTDGKQYRRTVF